MHQAHTHTNYTAPQPLKRDSCRAHVSKIKCFVTAKYPPSHKHCVPKIKCHCASAKFPPSHNHLDQTLLCLPQPLTESRWVKPVFHKTIKPKKNPLSAPLVHSQSPPPEGHTTQQINCIGPLSLHAEAWRACGTHPWVMSTITRGYRIQFGTKPPRFNGVLVSTAQGEAAQVLEAEIATLLSKGAIQRVPEGEIETGFYSRYFIIPKRDGGLRPILDLRVLNNHLRKFTFRMLTYKTLFQSIRRGDWFTTVDLMDAYFHIGVLPAHRKYLRFAFQGIAYEYTRIPFGYALAPRLFTKCVEAALAPLRHTGVRLSAFLDDYLICCPTRAQSERDTRKLVSHLVNLGFSINFTKSCLNPCQDIEYLGVRINSITYHATLSQRRVESFRQCLTQFQEGKCVPFRTCLRLAGLMASALSVVPMGLLRMREFQLWLSGLRLCPRRHLRRRVTISAQCLAALRWWREPAIFHTGSSLGVVSVRAVISTDASLTGWGAVYDGRTASGVWPVHLRDYHINALEMLAVSLALKHFLPLIRGCHVLIRTDNTTVVAYINRQGGTRSLRLHRLARELVLWAGAHLASIRATHVPGALNSGADLLSRGTPLYGEWTIHPQVVATIWERFGRAAVDLFASHENAQCPLYFSLRDTDAPLGVDALAHPWPNALLYAFPPLSLISPTLTRVREHGLSLLLVAPLWPGRAWVAEITQLLSGKPWQLPLRRDLLRQARGQIFHPHPDRLALWVWPVKGLI